MRNAYRRDLPEELTDASVERILRTLGEQGQRASRQGVSVAQFGPWEVVGRFDGGDRLEWIVVDTSPVHHDHAPVKVMGPVRQRSEAENWAKARQQEWRITQGQMPEWPRE